MADAALEKARIDGMKHVLTLVNNILGGKGRVRGKWMTKRLGRRHPSGTLTPALPPAVDKLFQRVKTKIQTTMRERAMTRKEAEAIEKAIMTAVSAAVSAALGASDPGFRGQIPKEWTNDEIRKNVRAALDAAVDK